jgi:hypothetical protein
MEDSGLARFAPLSGVLFIVLGIASFAVFGDDPPGTDKPIVEVVKFWRDTGDELFVAVILQGLAAISLVFFGGSLYKALRPAEGDIPRLALIAFAGPLIVAIGFMVDASVILTLADGRDDLSPAAIQALSSFYGNDFVPMAAGFGTLALSAGLLVTRSGVLPKWLGWIALLLFIVGLTPIGFAAFVGMSLWVAVVSVILFMRGGKAAPAAA